MPFTAAHPALVLPLMRLRWLSASGLVAGAIAPDFEYFLRAKLVGTFGHSPLGLVLFAMPMGILLAGGFHLLVLPPLLAAAPHRLVGGLARARTALPTLNASGLAVLGTSALIGAATHVLWDSFTHKTGWFVAGSPFLRRAVDLPGIGPIALYRVLQHGSTLVGLGILLVAFSRLAPVDAPQRSARVQRVARGLLLSGSLLGLVSITWLRVLLDGGWSSVAFGDCVAAAIAGCLLGLVVASGAWLLLVGANKGAGNSHA